jgi:integrase
LANSLPCRPTRRLRSADTLALAELAEEWLTHLQSRVGLKDARRRYSQRTVNLYRERLGLHVLDQLGNRPVDELTVADLRALIDRLTARGLAPGTVTSCLNITSGLLRFGVKQGYLQHNVARDLDRDDRPGSRRLSEPRYLTAEELVRVFAAMREEPFRLIAMVCAYAGLRISEALGLRWRDLDVAAGTLTVAGQLSRDGTWLPQTKTASSAATLPLLPVLQRELRAHRQRQASRNLALVKGDALVFVTSRGRPQSQHNAARALRRVADKAGLNREGLQPLGLHDLRHTFVGLALANPRLSLPEVVQLARHANAGVTLTVYAGLVGGNRKAAVAKLAEAGFGW